METGLGQNGLNFPGRIGHGLPMIAGSILNASETMARQKNAYVFSGRYSCLESIGVTVREQTGETNEQGS